MPDDNAYHSVRSYPINCVWMPVTPYVSDAQNEMPSAKVILGAVAFEIQFSLRYSFADMTILYFSGTLATRSALYLLVVLTAQLLPLLGGKKIAYPSCAWHDAAGVWTIEITQGCTT
jgi:hypothetical protein